MRILLVEDDRLLGDGLQAGLTQAGYAVDWLRDGDAAVAALTTESFAAVVLDLGLPKRDGLSVLQWLRGRHDATPVLILTARDQLEDKVRGLDLGADDYVLKPFDLDEITARLRALVRRAHGRPEPVITVGEIELNPAARTVTRSGQPVELTRTRIRSAASAAAKRRPRADPAQPRRAALQLERRGRQQRARSPHSSPAAQARRRPDPHGAGGRLHGIGHAFPVMTASTPYSLRRRLVWLLTSSVAVIWLLTSLMVYQRAHHEADELLDSQLAQVAETLLAIVAGGEVDHFVKELHEHAERYPVPLAIEIWRSHDGDAHRLVTSPGHAELETGTTLGFSEHPHQGSTLAFLCSTG